MNEIRKYLSTQISKADKKISEWDSDKSYVDVPGEKLNDSYIVTLGEFIPSQNGKLITELVPVEVRVLKLKKQRNSPFTVEAALNLGHKIREQVLAPKAVEASMFATILPQKLATRNSPINTDTIEIVLNFLFEINSSI